MSKQNERYLNLPQGVIYLRHNQPQPERRSILFIHGLGDSGLGFRDAFDNDQAERFNLIVPDLPGYGRSAVRSDYSFDSHVKALWQVVDTLSEEGAIDRENVVVVGHSMGGILGSMLCAGPGGEAVKKLVLVEGSITQYGSFISIRTAKAYKEGRFDKWFPEVFMDRFILKEFVPKHPKSAGFYASLMFCRRDAFLANALEIYRMRFALEGRKWTHKGGAIYAGLELPRIYCYGRHSLAPETVEFLREKNLETKEFDTDSHFVMNEVPDEFYEFLYEYLSR